MPISHISRFIASMFIVTNEQLFRHTISSPFSSFASSRLCVENLPYSLKYAQRTACHNSNSAAMLHNSAQISAGMPVAWRIIWASLVR